MRFEMDLDVSATSSHSTCSHWTNWIIIKIEAFRTVYALILCQAHSPFQKMTHGTGAMKMFNAALCLVLRTSLLFLHSSALVLGHTHRL